jgi:hypothetical protein
MAVRRSSFWDITQCSLVKVNSHFEGLLSLLFNPEDGGDTCLQNVAWLNLVSELVYLFTPIHEPGNSS